MYKKGDKVKFINAEGYDDGDMTVGKVYTVVQDQTGTCVRVITDRGNEYGPFAYRFELVKTANGVDGSGNPKNFTDEDLKPFQRAEMGDGRFVIVTLNAKGELGLTYEHASWMPACVNHDGGDSRFDIVAVYAPSKGHSAALTVGTRGDLIWQRKDAVKLQKQKEADEAVAAAATKLKDAEAEYAAAKAARAAI